MADAPDSVADGVSGWGCAEMEGVRRILGLLRNVRNSPHLHVVDLLRLVRMLVLGQPDEDRQLPVALRMHGRQPGRHPILHVRSAGRHHLYVLFLLRVVRLFVAWKPDEDGYRLLALRMHGRPSGRHDAVLHADLHVVDLLRLVRLHVRGQPDEDRQLPVALRMHGRQTDFVATL